MTCMPVTTVMPTVCYSIFHSLGLSRTELRRCESVEGTSRTLNSTVLRRIFWLAAKARAPLKLAYPKLLTPLTRLKPTNVPSQPWCRAPLNITNFAHLKLNVPSLPYRKLSPPTLVKLSQSNLKPPAIARQLWMSVVPALLLLLVLRICFRLLRIWLCPGSPKILRCSVNGIHDSGPLVCRPECLAGPLS